MRSPPPGPRSKRASSRRRRRPAARVQEALNKLEPANDDQRRRHRDRAPGARVAGAPDCRERRCRRIGHRRQDLRAKSDKNHGYDAQNDIYGDLVKLGIIDPTKVVRTALQDAASVAGLLIRPWWPMPPRRKPPRPCRRAVTWAAWAAAWASKKHKPHQGSVAKGRREMIAPPLVFAPAGKTHPNEGPSPKLDHGRTADAMAFSWRWKGGRISPKSGLLRKNRSKS